MSHAPTDNPWQVSVDDASPVELDSRTPDLIAVGPDRYHLLTDTGRSVEVEVLALDLRAKRLTLRVDGHRHDVTLLAPLDQTIARLGLEANPQPVLTELHAPMPGLVLRVEVEAGQAVAAGDTLLVLEAMKMENAIKSPAAGTVAGVDVSDGQAVEKGAVLIRFA